MKSPCRCSNCKEDGCRSNRAETVEEKKVGFFGRRPWIWVVIAHLALIAVLTTMVVISVKYRQAEVVVTHGR